MSDTTNTSAIDKAINAAKARKAMKAAANGDEGAPSSEKTPNFTQAREVTGRKAEKPVKEKAEKVQKDNTAKDAEKAAKKAAQDADRAERKAKRDEAREAKKAEREAKNSNKVAHMSKVDKAAEKLTKLDDGSSAVYNDITTNFSRAQIAALAEHLQHFNRVQATQRALTAKLTVGDTVRITGGDPRYVGQVGTLDKVQRIRCFCVVEGVSKPVYLFTSDVEKVDSEVAVAV